MLVLLVDVVYSECGCGYYEEEEDDDSFVSCMCQREGLFLSVALGEEGMTRDGAFISISSGTPLSLHDFSAPSKESLHLALLAKALSGNLDALTFLVSSSLCPGLSLPQCQAFARSQGPALAMAMLTQKLVMLQRFLTDMPGFGGFLPWYQIDSTSGEPRIVPVWDWKDPFRVPALDNGEMVWGLIACASALGPESPLAQRIQSYLNVLAENAPVIFDGGNGCIRAVATIFNASTAPTPSNYATAEGGCLDDPYEGEMMVVFMDLFSVPGSWMEAVWKRKLKKLVPVVYDASTIVQQGFWFSAHEQWKYAFLPYLSIPLQKTLFFNGEMARTHFSASNRIPGLFASCANVTANPDVAPNYLSATGIASLASQTINSTYTVTPYGSWSVLLANRSCGLAWYRNMISGTGMSGPLGSTEACSVDGAEIAPVVTWDSKVTSVLAALGGVGELTAAYMDRANVTSKFVDRIEKLYGAVFGSSLSPSTLGFHGPTAGIPRGKITTNMCPNQKQQ